MRHGLSAWGNLALWKGVLPTIWDSLRTRIYTAAKVPKALSGRWAGFFSDYKKHAAPVSGENVAQNSI